MPRITVTAETPAREGRPVVLFDEQVRSIHLDTGHAAAQLVERIAWAIVDAEHAETPQDAPAAPPVLLASNEPRRPRFGARPQTRPSRRVVSFTGVRVA